MIGADFPNVVLEALRQDTPAIRAGLPFAPPELRELTVRALDFATADALDASEQGALGALIAHGGGRTEVASRLVDAWIARRGAAFAIRAAVTQRKLVTAHPRDARKPGGFDPSVRWLDVRREAQLASALDRATWDALRAAAKRTKKGEDRADVARAIAEMREETPLLFTCWIDGILPDARCAVADIDAFLALDPSARTNIVQWVLPLTCSLTSVKTDENVRVCTRVLEVVRNDPVAIHYFAPYATDLVALLGGIAAPSFITTLRAAHASKGDARMLKKVAEALLPLEDEPVAHFFSTMLESTVLRPVAARYMQLHPERAVGALGTGRAGTAMLRALAQNNPSAVRQGLSEMASSSEEDAALRKSIERTLRQTTGSREAEESELPWVLREPPWRRSRARPPMHIVTGLPTDFSTAIEQVHLIDGDEGDESDDSPTALLARDGARAITPLVARAMITMDDALFHALRRVESPRVAWLMALERRTSRRPLADGWLGRFADAAATGLLPIVLGPTGRDQATASAALLSTVAQGRTKVIRRVAARLGEEAARATEEWLSVAPFYDVPTHTPRLPVYADVTLMPRIALESGALVPGGAATLVEMMYFSDPATPYAGLGQVKQACDPRALDAWLLALMHAWSDAGASPSGRWVLAGLAWLGGTDAIRELSRSIKTWARKRETRARAIIGLEALATGNAGARTALTDFARKGLRGETAEKAAELMTTLARSLRLSQDDLADVLAPSLDLEPEGTCVLDFGPRRFTVSLDEHLAPRIVDEAGVVVHVAPKGRKSDDPVKARAASERLKSLRKGLGDLAIGAVFRFELAMVVQRRYRREVFDVLRAHPLSGRITRRLLWSAHDAESGERHATFRVGGDGTLADETDRPVSVAADDVLCVVHPLTLDASVIATWGATFSEYEIIQPFPQLGRHTFAITADERQHLSVRRFQGLEAPFMAICGRLESRGWQRQEPEEGMVRGYAKRFGERVAYYELAEPIVFGQPLPLQTKVGVIHFRDPLEIVGPIVFSEAAYDLHVFGDLA
jgi:hypothetical protein